MKEEAWEEIVEEGEEIKGGNESNGTMYGDKECHLCRSKNTQNRSGKTLLACLCTASRQHWQVMRGATVHPAVVSHHRADVEWRGLTVLRQACFVVAVSVCEPSSIHVFVNLRVHRDFTQPTLLNHVLYR